jgi:LysR family hydrogen peroxide-inducible transcriptional activator
MTMTLQELRFLISLAQEKHFGKASRACFVSQPTLSIAIRKLENELGVILFERDKNDVRITPLGQDIIERAKRVISEADAIKEVAKQDHDQLTGTLKLGVIYTIGPYLLPPLITTLNKLAPNIMLEIQEDYTANLREKLLLGQLDAIIISLPFSGSGIVTRTLYKEPFVVLMPSHHPLTKNKWVSQKDLNEYNVLTLGEGHCFRDQVIASCPACFVSSRGSSWHTVVGSSLETIRHMVASNMGITILPATAAMSSAYRADVLTTRPLKAASPSRIVALAWRKSFPRLKAIDMLLKTAEKCRILK